MAAGKQKLEPLIGERLLVGIYNFRHYIPLCTRIAHLPKLLNFVRQRAVTTQLVNGLALRRRRDPSGRILRRALVRPMRQRLYKGLLHGLFS